MRLPFILTLAILASAHAADTPPQVTVSDIRRVFHNGEHNAFTDLCRFRDRLYLTFRSCPDGHAVNPTASIIILQSADDGATWAPVHRFSVQHRREEGRKGSVRACVQNPCSLSVRSSCPAKHAARTVSNRGRGRDYAPVG